MDNAKLGLAIVLFAWIFSILSPILTIYDLIEENKRLESGYIMTQAEILIEENKINLEYIVEDEVFNKGINRAELSYEVVNGGLIKIMYDANAPENMEIVKDKYLFSKLVTVVITSILGIFTLKKVYPNVKRRKNKEYKSWKYVDAEIIDSNPYNQIIAINENDGKMQIYRSRNFNQDINIFLKSKDVKKVRVYIEPKNSKKIVIDYEEFLGGESNDK